MYTITLAKYTELLQQLTIGAEGATIEMIGKVPEVRFEARIDDHPICAGTVTLLVRDGFNVPVAHIGTSVCITGSLSDAVNILQAQTSLTTDMAGLMVTLSQFKITLE